MGKFGFLLFRIKIRRILTINCKEGVSRSVLLRMRNVSDKICTENQNTHFMFNNFFPENLAVYEIMWKNTLEPDSPQMTIRRTRIACWIAKATDTHSEYVILLLFTVTVFT
jgi:hypothetical protein